MKARVRQKRCVDGDLRQIFSRGAKGCSKRTCAVSLYYCLSVQSKRPFNQEFLTLRPGPVFSGISHSSSFSGISHLCRPVGLTVPGRVKTLLSEGKPAGGAGLSGGRQPPRGVSRTKTDTKCRFWEGGQHVPPPRVKKPRISAVLRGACRPWGGRRSLHFVPPSGGTLQWVPATVVSWDFFSVSRFINTFLNSS